MDLFKTLFKLIFYGFRTRRNEVIGIGWKIFLNIKRYNDLDNDICIVAKTLCQNNKNSLLTSNFGLKRPL